MLPDFLRAIREGKSLAVMVDIDHPDGMVYVWGGIGGLDYNGVTYKGLGTLGNITTAPRTSEIRVDNVILSLAGIEDPLLLNHITYEIRDRTATTYLAVLDDWSQVLGRIVIDHILLDYMIDVLDESGTVRLELHGEAGFWQLTIPSRRAWSPNDQKILYPADTGLDYVPLMENKETKWTPT